MKTKTNTYPPVQNLWASAIDIKPRSVDWSEGYPDQWDFFSANRCEKCKQTVFGQGGEKHCDMDEESECEGYVPQTEGPMMNYFYELPHYDRDPREDAMQLADLPVCIVVFEDGETGLALTGGGMDLSWEICEAYMRLGYLPPMHFGDLPVYAGRDFQSKHHQWIISGCRRSAQFMRDQATRRLRDLKHNFKRTAVKS